MAPRRRFPVVLTVVCAVALAILLSLGAWQVQRLQWKEDLLARIAAADTAQPVQLEQALARPDAAFARVIMTCPGLDRAPFVELYAIEDGQPGSRLISMCAPDMHILVDRGFVADTISARPPVDPASTMPVVVRGVLREGHAQGAFTPTGDARMLYARDIPALAERLGVQGVHPDLMVVAETSSNPEWQALRPVALPTGLTNSHLGYALTWFGLAAALAGVWLAMVLRKPKA